MSVTNTRRSSIWAHTSDKLGATNYTAMDAGTESYDPQLLSKVNQFLRVLRATIIVVVVVV